MIDSLNNYNPLGRLGPLSPRPEYRPPGSREGEGPQTSPDPKNDQAKPGRVQTASPQLGTKAKSSPESRLSLAAAQALTQEVSLAIAQLPPGSVNAGPHRLNPYWGLYYPRYV
ncbi:MAG: hypothetical protein LBR11_04200 [Deltaproteobacteria bacterium]|jgi:hypothetical protein|nr:hypothetical protein [Deltaproteobacteria bacterium]